MKRVLTLYWQYAKGIRLFGLLTILAIVSGTLLRDIIRPFALRGLIDGLSTGRPHVYIWQQVILFAVIHVGAQICYRSGEFLDAAFQSRYIKRLRNIAFAHMLKHSHRFFASSYVGSLVTRQKRFVGSAETLFDELIGNYSSIVINVVGILIVTAFISPIVMIGIMIWVACYVANAYVSSKKRLALDAAEAEEDSRVTGAFADAIGNISIVKAFGSSEYEKERFNNVTQRHYLAFRKAWKYANRQSVIQGAFSTILHVGSIATVVYLSLRGSMTPGDVVLMTVYAGQLSGYFWGFGKSLRRYSRAIGDGKEMVDIIDAPADIQDMPDARNRIKLDMQNASITFDHVRFGYGSQKPIFDDFTLHIPAGQKIAIIGSTGAGKTTLISLLMRTADIHAGSIRIGPYDIAHDVTQEGFKSSIAVVSQTIDLFNRTIGDNIQYGNPSVTHDKVAVAARKAHIHEFIETLPKGYDTMVGERGIKLSGGQRQRVGIARAFLHDAPILVFDEATSSLDNITEKEVQRILETDLQGKTVIMIAHRLSTIRNCDRIIVLEQGIIVQDGTHDELVLNSNGMYYQLLHSHDIAVKEEIYG